MITYAKTISTKYPVVTMGTFDGVHLGHQKLIKTAVERAAQNQGESIVITYSNHPKEILESNINPYLLTEKERKIELIQKLGADHIVFIDFDYQMSKLTADEFLSTILLGRFQMKEIVIGYDCHFGYQRSGDYQFLKNKQDSYKYNTLLIEPVKINGHIVSSSHIRKCLTDGKLEEAALFLGRNYDLQGTVVEGKKIGRELGFPTMNIAPLEKLKLTPPNGVYLSITHLDIGSYSSITNIGTSPTVKNDSQKTVECHLLEFSGEQYGKPIRVEFLKKIRDERKFSSREELKNAMILDSNIAFNYFSNLSFKASNTNYQR